MSQSEFLVTSSPISEVGRDAQAMNALLTAVPTAGLPAAPITTASLENPDWQALVIPADTPMVRSGRGLSTPGSLDPEKGSWWDAAWRTEGTMQAISDVFATHGFTADPNFRLPDQDSDEWKQTVGDLPVEYWEDFSDAASLDHFRAIARVARDQYQAEQTLAQYGGAGVAGRIAVAMLDPVSLGVGIASGGIGWLSKGTRVARAVKAGLAAAGQNAAIEAALAEASPTRDGHDVAYAALSGFVLGGTFGAIFSREEAARAVAAGERQALRQAQIEAADVLKPVASQADIVEQAARARHAEALAAHARVVDNELTALERDLAGIVDGPEGQAMRIAGDADTATERLRVLGTEIDQNNAVLFKDRAKEIDAETARLLADRNGPNSWVARTRRERRIQDVSEYARQKATQTVDEARARAKAQLEQQHALRERLQPVAERARKVRAAESDLTTLRSYRAAAKSLEEKIALLPEARRAALRRMVKAADLELADSLEHATRLRTGAPAIEPGATTEDVIARSFGDDSVGSAATGDGVAAELRPVPSPEVEVAETKMRGARFDLAATLRGSVRGARNLVGRYVGDSVGAVDGQVNQIGASEHAARLQERLVAKFYSALTPAYNKWAAQTGKGWLSKWSRPTRNEFNTLVTRAIRGDANVAPEVAEAAAGIRKVFADVLKEAKAAGVRGFEDVAENPNYVPRVFNYRRLHRLMEEFGAEGVTTLVRGAMRARVPEEVLDDTVLDVIAKGYVTRLREVGMGLDSRLTNGLSLRDTDALAGMLRDARVDEATIDDVVSRLKMMNAKSDTGEGSVRYAKMRVDLDEAFAVELSGPGGRRVVRVDELFENDVEHLMGRYARSMSGHIGMAKIGVRSFTDHQKNLEALASVYEGQPEALEKVRDAADLAYKLVTGQPIENLGAVSKWSRFLRDYNFTRTMNQAGFAQIPDLAGLFSSSYLRHTLQHLPELRTMMSRGTDGKLKDEFARELEELLGVGTDYHNVAVFSMFDVDADGFVEGALGKAEHAFRVMGRGTQAMSGMAAVTAAAQRLMAKAIVQRFVSGKLPVKRLAGLGIDDALHARIKDQLDRFTQTVPGDSGRKVKQLNIGAWTDVEARDAFLSAVHKEARRLVQEEDVGDTAKWMHLSLGKLIIQFRRFGIVSYTKQLLHGVNHRDAEEGTRMMMSFALASAAYWAQQQVRMAGMSESAQREWERKYLSGDRLAAAAFARSSYSSLLPAVSDSVTSMVFGVKAFDVRASGQPSDVFGGISTVDAINKFARVTSKGMQSAWRNDRQFTQGDLDALRQLMPYGNLIPMQYAFEALVKPGLNLPKKQVDTNPDTVDSIF